VSNIGKKRSSFVLMLYRTPFQDIFVYTYTFLGVPMSHSALEVTTNIETKIL